MRILGIDYGDVRTGIAYTDELQITVQPYKTIKHNNSDKILLAEIENIIQEKNIYKIIVGMPDNADGTKGDRAIKTEQFIHKLKCRFNKIEIDFVDERYTSLEADEFMYMMNVKKEDRKNIRDTLAAVYILKSYLKNQEIDK